MKRAASGRRARRATRPSPHASVASSPSASASTTAEERTGGSSEELLRFTRAAREPFADEAPEVIGTDELAQRFGAPGRTDLLERAVALGLLRPLGEGSRTRARGYRAPARS